MRKHTAQLRVLSRNAVRNVKSGKARISITETADRKTGYSGSAKNARINMTASVTSGLGKLGEEISDMRIVTGSLMGSSRSFAANVKDGKTRMSFTKIGHGKTV